MLRTLRETYSQYTLNLIQGTYFDVPFGSSCFDAAVSVESLHHFTMEEKLPLYRRLCGALKPVAVFVLTDYLAPDEDYERFYRSELLRLKAEQGISDGEFYHYDTPLTVAHETQALLEAGFRRVEVLNQWGCTCTLKAVK